MEIERITKVSELDQILPLMQKVHDGDIYKGKSFSAYINYCAFNLIFSDLFAILVFKDPDVVGYTIAHIGNNQFENHCTIVDAYMEKVDSDAVLRAFYMIEEWALKQNCIYMESFSTRSEAICRKYGFTEVSKYIRKPIGGVK